jgi:hypothetical protein
MFSAVRVLARIALLVVLALTATAAWFSWFFDLDDYRDRLAVLLSQRTGLSIELNGRIEHHLLNGLHIRIADVKARLGPITIADIGQVRAQIALRDLLDRRLTIERLEIDARRLDLAALPDVPRQEEPAAEDAPDFVLPFTAVAIDHLRLELQTGRLADPQSGRELLIQDVVADFGPLSLWPDNRLLERLIAGSAALSVRARGGQLAYSGIQLGSFTAELSTDGGQRLDMTLDAGRLRWDGFAGGDILRSAEADVTATARIRFNSLATPRDLHLEQLNLSLNAGRLSTTAGPYDVRRVHLMANALTVLATEAPATPGPPGQRARALSGAAVQLTIEGLDHHGRTIDSLALDMAQEGSRLVARRLSMVLAGTRLDGEGQIELGDARLPWRLQIRSGRIAMEPLLAFFNSSYDARGDLDLTLNLQGQGLEPDRVRETLGGRILMRGGPLQVRGVDLDQVLTHLEKSHRVGLLDIGAYALAGPAGALLSKGTDYSQLLSSTQSEGLNDITRLHSDLRIDNGVLHTGDVAIATPRHRLAVKGNVDLRRGGPVDLQIATLDPDGCARYQENIGGSAAAPRVRQAGAVVKGVIHPVRSVVVSVLGAVTGGCPEPFYQGAVPHPAPADAPADPSPEPSLDP